jgi:hypothetical protein
MFMKPSLLLLALFLAIACRSAHADPLYDFALTDSSGNVFTFTLSSDPNGHTDFSHGEAMYFGIPISENDVLLAVQPASSNSIRFEPSNGYANELDLAYGPPTFRNLYVTAAIFPESLATITQNPVTLVDAVSFLPGSYTANISGGLPASSLTITEEAPTPVPEPPSFLLAAIGIGALALMHVRRRLSGTI